MRKLVVTALLAATLMPVAAQAQSYQELRHDRRDIREEQRDLRQAYRSGDPRDVREQRRDVRDARQEYREDLRDRDRNWGRDDWRGWRDRNPNTYARGSWNAPFGYTSFRPGLRIGAPYYGSRYIIADPYRYHLRRPGWGQQWVRHYNDVILVDTRRGYVVDVIRGFYR
ncbi:MULTISPECIES: RcnB family protein [unclassified Sphingomonas]|uniref:RcnB family protein n=1 Tax=unclassified Sphingomonas TaxID=196159 RepID=UPI000288CBD9|nr:MULTISPECIES: RcnB family protein [unclassified Sphingomonas]